MSEPVAWMSKDYPEIKFYKWEEAGYIIPLYTHPMRELTNEEIMEVANEVFNTYKNWGYYQIDFARAILKKASERA